MTSRRTGHILIVDDEPLNGRLFSRYLERDGHTAQAVETGQAALAALAPDNRYDLLLLDLMLPDMSGMEVLERLKADQSLRHIPVVVVSALDDMEGIVRCIEIGADDYLTKPVNRVMMRARVDACLEKKWLHDQEQAMMEQLRREKKRADDLLQRVIPLGIALSAEKDFDRLLESILQNARQICNAEGGTLYLRTAEDELRFEIVRNERLGLALGGATGEPMQFATLRLYDPVSGAPNHHNVATHAALTGAVVNIPDAYQAEGYDFQGARTFDRARGYRSQSFLTIPLKKPDGRVVGVLQLINACDPHSGQVIPFDGHLQELVESLSALASVALEFYIREQSLKEQIRALQVAIDEKEKARQVAEITGTDFFRDLQQKARRMRSEDAG